MFQPVIKWSGSKRSQSIEIISHFPNEINTYYEPFCGGASVLRALLESNIKVNRYVCSDINKDLINLWLTIKTSYEKLYENYNRMWTEMSFLETQLQKQMYYNRVRERYNQLHIPSDFFFLNRTCYNGLIRYNQKGQFNSPFHLNRNGIEPDKMYKIIKEWNKLILENDVEFIRCSYDKIYGTEGDFIYYDPPYANTKGMYNNNFDKECLFSHLRKVKCKYALSYDGTSGNDNNIFDVPKDLYNTHIMIKSGNSPFKRLIKTDNKASVFESLYLN